MLKLCFKIYESSIRISIMEKGAKEILNEFLIDFSIYNTFNNIDELENYIKDTIIDKLDINNLEEDLDQLASELANRFENLISEDIINA